MNDDQLGMETPQPVMSRGHIRIRPSGRDDLGFVLEVESHPDHTEHVGQWSRDRHRACMKSSDALHWIIEAAGSPIGYAVLEDADDPNRSLLLRRIAIRGKGRGHGSGAVRLMARYCFEVLEFHRFWLFVAVDNRRAIRFYHRLGFVREGTARDCERRGDEYQSMHIFSMLEDEYRAKLKRSPACK